MGPYTLMRCVTQNADFQYAEDESCLPISSAAQVIPMNQRPILLTSILIVAVTLPLNAQDETKRNPITAEELNQRTVVGQLGLPLGTATEIDAEIVSGNSLRVKRYHSRYLLKVTHVAGNKRNKDITLEFYVPGFASVGIASDTFALYELKNDKKTERLNSEQIAELEKGYVGKSVRLVVYLHFPENP